MSKKKTSKTTNNALFFYLKIYLTVHIKFTHIEKSPCRPLASFKSYANCMQLATANHANCMQLNTAHDGSRPRCHITAGIQTTK